MPLDHAWLLAHLPHQGSMCLLDGVTEWNARLIRCTASSHRHADNPLRAQDGLGAVCGVEYAAQAMAAHGALLTAAAGVPRAGYLASVRSVDLHVARLDDIAADLDIEAERLSGDDNTILYDFRVAVGNRLLLSGRATVVLDADKWGGST
ncbi:MAG: 3-hydroxylacyl-ACP dehydratase [Thiobacillus sp. 63-78]|uniref:3-hydroxylacyl-ACP dehydratase n=1 Tax=Thiobacillus sp. 63-78 TaxID=1895859 RepID=UPI000965BB8E|nr:3-hydroxylacyl-ACP dehydratase [Thiobacillus sp. 63-78]MBN8762590.1 3-hydroxylacyl-ACP dehydratase [Thiobacillus sp.]MBN8774035.1 3-hydroxylacyl-ACP dehydratase [Thiobacillus sp.]OJZ15801.1 MAG: 3-hydroxylacyl-ACP dehydratase [Thiobacillus sp. 63-78]